MKAKVKVRIMMSSLEISVFLTIELELVENG